jgi:hypothetical protein
VDLARRFLPLLGTWTGLERLDPDADATPTTARASLALRLDVASTVVVSDYRQVRADGAELSAHGVFQAGPGPAEVRWWLFDSTGRPPAVATGWWDQDALVLDQAGRRHRLWASGDVFEQQVTTRTGPDGSWRPVLTGSYRRMSGH